MGEFRKIWEYDTLCSILDDMRTCCKTADYSSLPALIEKAQTAANHMESSLDKMDDIHMMLEKFPELRRAWNRTVDDLEKAKAEYKKVTGKAWEPPEKNDWRGFLESGMG